MHRSWVAQSAQAMGVVHDHWWHAQSGRADEEAEASEELQQALLVLLARLEALAVSAAAGELMPALAPALERSLADVCGQEAAPEDSAAVWECLSDLLCSPDAHAAQVSSRPRRPSYDPLIAEHPCERWHCPDC